MSANTQLLTLTPEQYKQFASANRNFGGISGMAVGDPENPTGYTMPYDQYSRAYDNVKNYTDLSHNSGIMSPADLMKQQGASATPVAKSANGISPLGNISAPPSYEQFAASQAGKASPVYSGGAAPAGMNPADAQVLQNIYAPKKADGGFVGNYGITPQPPHFSDGGMPNSSEMASWVTRKEAAESVPHTAGLFKSSVPGRTDKLDTIVPGGSYVLPADVVSGLGEGNTMAGSAVLDKMFHSNPFGIQGAKMHGGIGIPHTPGAPHQQVPGRADGGPTPTRIIAAGGEYLVHPDAVKRLGGGSMKKGHRILDHFVVHARKKTAAEMNKLPGPKK